MGTPVSLPSWGSLFNCVVVFGFGALGLKVGVCFVFVCAGFCFVVAIQNRTRRSQQFISTLERKLPTPHPFLQLQAISVLHHFRVACDIPHPLLLVCLPPQKMSGIARSKSHFFFFCSSDKVRKRIPNNEQSPRHLDFRTFLIRETTPNIMGDLVCLLLLPHFYPGFAPCSRGLPDVPSLGFCVDDFPITICYYFHFFETRDGAPMME